MVEVYRKNLKKNMKVRFVLLFILVFFAGTIHSDVWDPPSIKSYKSENGQFLLKVYPTEIPENYSKWLSAKPKKKSKFSAEDTAIVHCHAILYEIYNSDTIKIWDKKLINRFAPNFVIVANDGKSIVTFDNWSSLGYGVDVMVTYDESGNMVKRYNLEEFSPFPINNYSLSITSIWWLCGAKYISNDEIEICFSDDKDNTETRIYNLSTKEFR
ncbi:hypothetical protein [Proteiniphilum saccharofermentans]|nr:hypothetical protein [Proteiniphilum saccharofermentans]